MTDYEIGDFVTDGVLRGLILGPCLTCKLARHIVDIYQVNIGGGRETVMFANQIRLISKVDSVLDCVNRVVQREV